MDIEGWAALLGGLGAVIGWIVKGMIGSADSKREGFKVLVDELQQIIASLKADLQELRDRHDQTVADYMALKGDFSRIAEKLTATGLYPFPVWLKYIFPDGRQMVIIANDHYQRTFLTKGDAFFREVSEAFGDEYAKRFAEIDRMASETDGPVVAVVDAPTHMGPQTFLVAKWAVHLSDGVVRAVAGMAIPYHLVKRATQ